jgi:hypothetical protein
MKHQYWLPAKLSTAEMYEGGWSYRSNREEQEVEG